MDSFFPRIGGKIDDVTSAADQLTDLCRQLDGRVRDSEFLLITLRREFATWVLRSLEASESLETSNLGITDTEVLALVRQNVDRSTGQCSSCMRTAPLNDEGLCAWGCSPRSPLSVAP